jgi:glycogen debranching enzyme
MAHYVIDTQGQFEPHLHQEWLLTNGQGAFASGAFLGCNTRRYHGMLCAATLQVWGPGQMCLYWSAH